MSTSKDRNPHQICTLQPVSSCQGCKLGGQLKCRFSWGDLLHFIGMFALPAVTAGFGLVRGGYEGALFGWIGFMLFFFFVWENRILCRHCPYYAEESATLHKYICAQCVNFSCPLNAVPRPLVDSFLQRNPVMRLAWEAAGWQVKGSRNV